MCLVVTSQAKCSSSYHVPEMFPPVSRCPCPQCMPRTIIISFPSSSPGPSSTHVVIVSFALSIPIRTRISLPPHLLYRPPLLIPPSHASVSSRTSPCSLSSYPLHPGLAFSHGLFSSHSATFYVVRISKLAAPHLSPEDLEDALANSLGSVELFVWQTHSIPRRPPKACSSLDNKHTNVEGWIDASNDRVPAVGLLLAQHGSSILSFIMRLPPTSSCASSSPEFEIQDFQIIGLIFHQVSEEKSAPARQHYPLSPLSLSSWSHQTELVFFFF